MWFNNIVIYQFKEGFEKSLEEIQLALEEHRLKPCPPHARQSQGWTPPFSHSEEKAHLIYGCHVLVAAKEVRLLPANIIKAVLNEKTKAFEQANHKPMRRAELLQLKEEIEFELLPKAFTVEKKEWLYIDTVNQWIVINTSSYKKASETITLLTKALGSLSVVPLTMEADLSSLFSQWLHEPSTLPEGLFLGNNCVLINSGNDKSLYNCKDIEHNLDEIKTLIKQGYSVSSLELSWRERVQFTLTDDCLLKRLKCVDYLEDEFKENSKLENEQAIFDANFSLLAGEVRELVSYLISTCVKTPAKTTNTTPVTG